MIGNRARPFTGASRTPSTCPALASLCAPHVAQRWPVARSRHLLHAKRLSKEEAAAGEWASLLREADHADSELGSSENLNELCNRGLKLMLRGNQQGLQDFRDELNLVGKSFTDQENLDGALFIYVIFMMTEHTIVQQAENLTGLYEAAFKQVFFILEDSGWKLVKEGEESDQGSDFEDLPNLGYIQNL